MDKQYLYRSERLLIVVQLNQQYFPICLRAFKEKKLKSSNKPNEKIQKAYKLLVNMSHERKIVTRVDCFRLS